MHSNTVLMVVLLRVVVRNMPLFCFNFHWNANVIHQVIHTTSFVPFIILNKCLKLTFRVEIKRISERAERANEWAHMTEALVVSNDTTHMINDDLMMFLRYNLLQNHCIGSRSSIFTSTYTEFTRATRGDRVSERERDIEWLNSTGSYFFDIRHSLIYIYYSLCVCALN